MIKAVVRRLRLARQVEPPVHVPLAHVAGRVSRLPQKRGDGDLFPPYVHWREHGDPVVNADAVGRAPGHQAGSGRRAVGGRRIAVGETHAFGGQTIQVGRLDPRMAVAGQVAVAQVVGQGDDEVRAPAGTGDPRLGPRRRLRPKPRRDPQYAEHDAPKRWLFRWAH